MQQLEGISNWINNCLIPISRRDLSEREELCRETAVLRTHARSTPWGGAAHTGYRNIRVDLDVAGIWYVLFFPPTYHMGKILSNLIHTASICVKWTRLSKRQHKHQTSIKMERRTVKTHDYNPEVYKNANQVKLAESKMVPTSRLKRKIINNHNEKA